MFKGLVAVCFWFVFSAVSAQAAVLTASDDPDCMGRFEGQIGVGDYDAFVQAAAAFLRPANPEEGTGDVTICLNSPGGSLLEATRIAAFLEENWIGTVIDDGDSCLSACAILFMLGTQAYVEDTGFNRKMHVNGRLGFHRPAFSLPEGEGYSSKDVEKSFEIAILATLEFVKLANRLQDIEDAPMIQADLMEKMFEHQGDDFFYVDRVDQAGRWQIGVFGWTPPTQISAREALLACDNLSNWTTSLAPSPVIAPEVSELPFLVRRVRNRIDSAEVVWEVTGRVDGMGDRMCQIAYEDGRLMACGGDHFSKRPIHLACDFGDTGKIVRADSLAIFPSETALAALPTEATRIAAEAQEIALRVTGDMPSTCAASQHQQVRVVNVDAFVNIRSEAAFGAQVIAEAPKFMGLEVVRGGARLVGDAARRDACIAACRAHDDWSLRQNAPLTWARERTTALACINDNVIWWNVALPDGRSGWASAKYLR